MGRHGIYYRTAIPSGAGRPASLPGRQSLTPTSTETHSLQEIESADVAQMTDSSSAELLSELDQKRHKMRLVPIVTAIAATTVLVLFYSSSPAYLTGAVLVAGFAAFWLAKRRDELAKTVVLFYDLESDAEQRYQQLHDAFDELSRCGGIWHVEAQGGVTDRKRHAGASSVIRRKAIRLTKGDPPYVKTNIEIPTLPVGRQTLYLFPDRLLVFEANGVGAVPYERMTVERRETRFIEEGTVPNDANVVDHTWRYVNKKGGPDKRFNNNRQLPIALYEEIVLASESGLNELVQVSKVGAGQAFEKALLTRRSTGAGGAG